MIIKELENIKTNDKFEQAGYNAESQLAFYLNKQGRCLQYEVCSS